MTQFLPPNLLALFAARDPIPFLPPADKLSWEKRTDGYTGIAHLVSLFEDPNDTPPPTVAETREERMERKRKEKAEQMAYKLEQEIAMWDPNGNVGTTDPYKTLFVARVNYDTSESKLRREFEIYGPIKKIVVVHNNVSGKPRGYAFIEYEHERDMHSAYKNADGKKLDNRRVLVDVERARTVKGWLPRRLGGGLGGTRRGGPDVNIKHSGREDDRKRRDDDHDRPERADSRPRERRHSRDRSRERARDQDRRRKRSRSRDRKRRRSRSRDRDGEERSSRRHRSRSRDRKRRSRSRERKHRRDRDRGDRNRNAENEEGNVKIKQEPEDDYPDYNQGSYYNNIPLKDEDSERIQRIKNGVKYEEDEQQPPMAQLSQPPPPPPPPPPPHPQHMENDY